MSSAGDANPTSEKTLPASVAVTPYDANGVDRSLVRWMLRQTRQRSVGVGDRSSASTAGRHPAFARLLSYSTE
jgi:hypothetical protein